MPEMRRRFAVLCQQSTVLAVVAAVGLSAVGVVELDVVAPSGPQAVGGAGASQGGLSLVSAAPVEPTVRSVPLVARAQKARRDAELAGRTSGPLVVTSAPEKAPGYATVGVTWRGGQQVTEDDVTVSVRTRGESYWSPWQEMHFDPDHGPEPAEDDTEARSGTDAVVVGDVRRVQARVTVLQGETPTGLELDVVDPGDEERAAYESAAIDTAALGSPAPVSEPGAEATTASAVQAAGVSAPKPQIFSRDQWGADESLRDRGSLRYGDIDGGFVHHTVNANDYSRDQVPSLLRGIYAYHTRSLGWSDIGYNFLVDRFGRIWEGRYGGVARPVVGAHTLGYNEDSFAMSAIGNFETAQPSDVMLDAYAKLFAWKLGLHGIRGDDGDVVISGDHFKAISGHRDAGSTACPGRYLYAQLPAIRRATAAAQSGRDPDPTPPPPTPEPEPEPVTTTDRDADLSGRSFPDLVARDKRTGRAVVIRTGGMLEFEATDVVARDLSSFDLVAAADDLDGDGTADLVARRTEGGEAVLLRGEAAGARFRADRTYTEFARLDLLTGVGDLDGDGNADLVGRTRGGALRLYPGKGNGAFAPHVTLAASWAGYDLTTGAGDLDGDGDEDLLARSGSQLYLVPGTGDGALGQRRALPGSWGGYDLVTGRGDATGDGRDDLVVRVRATGLTYVLPGDGAGSVEPRIGGWSQFAQARWVALAGQLAGNRMPDLVGLARGGALQVHPHSGRTNIEAVVATDVDLGEVDVLLNVGDWDGDGHGDFMTRRPAGAVLLYRGRGDDTFAAPVRAAEGWSGVDLLAPLGDVTGDGRPDLLGRYQGALRVYPSNGTTGFRKSLASPGAGRADRVVGVDTWGGDRLADVVLRRPDGTLVVTSVLGDGKADGTRVGTGAGGYDWMLGQGDVDGRGRSDIVARQPASGELWLLRGTKDGFSRVRLGSGFERYDLGG
ncbi:hypothetical protein G7072_03790 [Nocardioides sp. HDW12B]|uniref:FG-GAP-like repeat-containing protein n=1 Tax=Nocardioides sp. HDW12B TaxID=2714939 RepID=UPI0014095199|nr:FG-GAP-like repeat-containing protein [Nocardioides sp. HDW12B]QIK65574.1 hypothetical protein G7072_03790 [Nocardioides sp. HDW12B]